MKLEIGFTGDFCPQERVEQQFNSGKWESLFSNVKSFFDGNDLNIADLECPLLNGKGSPILKTGPHLKSRSNTAEILNYLNVKLVATANNHFYDFGTEGLSSTYDSLKKREINWFGSGYNLDEASKPYFYTKNGLTIAFINAAENEWSTTHGERPGVNPLEPVAMFNQISRAKENADFVVIVAHSGFEHYELPLPRIKEMFRFFIDCGANAVINHHTHIMSGYEIYKDCPIFYSVGNFCFDWPGLRNQPWNYGMLVKLIFEEKNTVKFDIQFIHQNDDHVGIKLLKGEAHEKQSDHISKLNTIINDDKELHKSFEKFSSTRKDVYLTWIEPYTGKYLPGLKKRGILPSLLTPGKKRLLANIIRCESHRDLLLDALKEEK